MSAWATVICTAAAPATTLKPISGDEQIRQAEAIFRGKVERIDMARDWSKPRGPVITTIQLTPITIYKGSVPTPVSLSFLGGAADGVELKVEGMPNFELGQEYVLFVSANRNLACPVVGWTEGRLKVDRSVNAAGAVAVTPTASDWLHRTSIARSRAAVPSAVGLTQFESLLRDRIAHVGSSK